MNKVTQTLFLLSYAVLGLAAALFLPFAGITTASANLIGALVFIGAWQLQISFFNNKKNTVDEIDMYRVEAIEKLVLKLKEDVVGLQETMEEHSEKGDQKDKKLVSELKVLQEYLVMVMQKETKGGIKSKPKASATPKIVKEQPDPEDQFTAEDLEELGLTPEEAASAVIDGGHDEVAPEDKIPDAADPDMLDENMVSEMAPSAEKKAANPNHIPETSTTAAANPAVTATMSAAVAQAHRAAPKEPSTSGAKENDKTKSANAKKPTPRAAPAKRKAPIRLIKREDQLLSVVKNSLSENRVDLYLQPIVSLPSRKTEHFECFSRVRDEEGRIVLPRQYMKVAETKGLIGTIDNLLLFRLIQLIRKLGKRKPNIKFFCNMSRYSMSDNAFFPQFVDFMASNSEFSDRLVFEISQEDYLTLDDDVLDRLSTLGRKGFGFSMDMVNDFNQDFVALGEQHFRFIKADLTDIMASSLEPGDIDEQRIFLQRNGMTLIASRIENEGMVINTLDNQIELAQGYLFGEPLAANDMNDDL